MVLNGARIYNEGVGISHDIEEKIQQIVNAIKTLSPSSEVSLRFLKSGRVYEGLLWGTTNGVPIGAYNRGPSLSHVLDTIYGRIKKDCMKILKYKGKQATAKPKTQSYDSQPLALAG